LEIFGQISLNDFASPYDKMVFMIQAILKNIDVIDCDLNEDKIVNILDLVILKRQIV